MFLPIGINVEGRLCLLVGGSRIAAHNCRTLLEHGARVRVVSEEFSDESVWSHARVKRIQAPYTDEYLSGASVIIAATNNSHINRKIVRHAQAANLTVLSVDSPAECEWILPATFSHRAFTATFSPYGPLSSLAERVETDAPPESTESLDKSWYPDGGGESQAHKPEGKVYLVGAGPGDLDLITVKGAKCLRSATVVIHDALANSELMDIYCTRALRIDVSKRKGLCLHMQPEINRMLIDWARRGHTVVRLKGGDPMIFGRGGEEARALAEAGIRFEIVPGVSSLSAVPAYAGIPLTDREYGEAEFAVYSLHRCGSPLSEEQWRKMAEGTETLVLFMGMTLLPTVVDKLQMYGRKGSTPIALITQGTTAQQHEVIATLDTMLEHPALNDLQGPGLIVVGRVVAARAWMGWFHPQEKCHQELPHASSDRRRR